MSKAQLIKDFNNGIKSEQEKKAIESVNTKMKLRTRINATRSCLIPEFKKYFKDYRLDYKNKRAIGYNNYVLQWETRHFPNQPESYENQQTTCGTVSLEVLVK